MVIPPPPPGIARLLFFCHVEIFRQTPSWNLDPPTPLPPPPPPPEKIFWIRACCLCCLLFTGCDINIRADYGVLHSPGYKSGNQYPSSIHCNWFLAPIAQRETTLIIHSFHTEINYDTLQVKMFKNVSDSLLLPIEVLNWWIQHCCTDA